MVFTAHDYHDFHGAEFGIPDMVAVNKGIFPRPESGWGNMWCRRCASVHRARIFPLPIACIRSIRRR